MSSRSHLDASIHAFGVELRSFVQRASDSITALKRTAEQRPQAGVQDFKECLEDLEQQVADYTDEIQQLAQCTADSISFEELIGHCSAVYGVNRATALALEQHLAQYGYQRHARAVLEPECLQECRQDDSEVLYSEEFEVHTARKRQANSLPASPVSKGSLAQLRGSLAAGGHIPSRLGRSQPGSPIAAAAAPTAGALAGGAGDTMLLRDVAPLSTVRGLLTAGTAGTAVPQTQLRQQSRVSLGSNTSSTPPGLLISPSVAALANKYATSSAGGSSVGLSLPEQQFTGGPDTTTRPRRSPCRDLNLSNALADANSPDLPIFGRSTATTPPVATPPGVICQQQQQQTPARAHHGSSIDDDSTGELYSSLIHSNMQSLGRRDPTGGGTSDLEVTPPCTRSGVSPCSSPQAPATAGRLPPTWVSEKMQQLDNLQADVTLTLSQMKRCPSRSRTAPAAADSDSDSEDGAECSDAPPPPLQQQQQHTAGHVGLKHDQQLKHGQQHKSLRSSAAAAHDVGPVLPSATAHQQHLQAPQGTSRGAGTDTGARDAQLPVTTGSRAAAAAPRAGAASGGAKPYSSTAASLTAAAAAASADLESLMASLSMKYALGDDQPRRSGGNMAAAAMEVDPEESPSPGSPDTTATAAAAAATGDDDSAAGSSSMMTPSSQQTAQPTVASGLESAAGGRVQSSIRRAQPAAEVHRLEEIPGFFPQQGCISSAPRVAAAATDATAGSTAVSTAAALSADHGSSGGSSLTASSRWQAATTVAGEQQAEHSVLRPMQIQEHTTTAPATGDGAANAAAFGLRQTQQREQQQQQVKAKQSVASAATQQQQQAEALTPRAARLQRRLQQQQQQQQSVQEETENTCPSKSAPASVAAATTAASTAAAAAPAGSAAGAGVKACAITAQEFSQLPGWCRSLLTVELLNGVLQELAELAAGRCQAGREDRPQEPGGFTAEDVALLGHSSSQSKTIVSCLHKLSRATLQRSATGGNVYRLAYSS